MRILPPPPICNLVPRLFIASVFFLVLFLAAPSAAPAADTAAHTAKVADTAANPAKPPSEKIIGDADTQVVVDTVHHIVRIMIDGREVAYFDADGLRIQGDLQADQVISVPKDTANKAKKKQEGRR